MSNSFSMTFTAEPQHIDVMGHVNNAVWVQWMEALAGAHWERDATPEQIEAYIWLVVRHEIDYRGNVSEGESVEAETTIPEGPRGPRFTRHYLFRNSEGKELVRAQSTWVMLDKATGKLMRVPEDLTARFIEA